ncbi:MAG: putative zinc-binding protein [Candidatus Wallbacteria bacterium]
MSNVNQNSCSCSAAPKLIFPCSGGSDVGEITDRAARKVTIDGAGKMYCLAGIGGGVSGIIATTESAAKVIAIDGCPLSCAKKTLEKAGITNIIHINLHNLGLEKLKSPATEENINKVAAECAKQLGC